MNERIPKYALIEGYESTLVEVLRHCISDDVICVFEADGGIRRYVTEAEWLAGAELLTLHVAKKHMLTKSGKLSKRKRPVIGQIGGGKKAQSGLVDVATFQSLVGKDDLGIPHAKLIVNDYELVICDECHYGAAPNLQLVMKDANARRVYGLSATPKRPDGLERIVFPLLNQH